MLYLITITRPDEAEPITRFVDMSSDDAKHMKRRLEKCLYSSENYARSVFSYSIEPVHEIMIDLHQFINDDLEPLEQDLPA